MKFGVLSDAHGNALGLKACLDHLAAMQVDEIVFLGDMIGYLPDVSATIGLLRASKAHCLLGNHDAMWIGATPLNEQKDRVYRIGKAGESMSDEDRDFVASLKPWHEVDADGRKLLFVHGSPRNPLNEYVYPDAEAGWFDAYDYDAFFMGHTHRPFMRSTPSNKLVVNVGSCGLPRDQGNLMSFAVYDSFEHSCEVFRVALAVDALLERYADAAHESVRNCLQRTDNEAFGRIIHAYIN